MDYKEKYEQALERAREFACKDNAEVAEYIFPELTESNDERIRKDIKIALMSMEDNLSVFYSTHHTSQKELLSWLESQGEKKPAWSEEDEKILNLIIARLHSHPNVEAEEYGKDYHWFNSLKNRVQPKQEWSEEDENHVDSLLKRLKGLCRNEFATTRFAISEDEDWLKSLRPQNTWKPSDEQIWCLSDAVKHYNSLGLPAPKLKELLNDLKKLREE